MYRLMIAGLLFIGGGLITPATVQGADKEPKARKEKPAAKAPVKEERPASRRYKGDSTNDSIFTQQQAADSFAAKVGTAPTTQKSATSTESPKLIALDSQIQSEKDRHVTAAASLQSAVEAADKTGDTKQSAKARKALDKEESAYQKKKSSLDKQRQELVRKAAAAEPAPMRAGKTAAKK